MRLINNLKSLDTFNSDKLDAKISGQLNGGGVDPYITVNTEDRIEERIETENMIIVSISIRRDQDRVLGGVVAV